MNIDYNDYSANSEFAPYGTEYWTVNDGDIDIGEIYKISTKEYRFVWFHPANNSLMDSKVSYTSMLEAKKALIDYEYETNVQPMNGFRTSDGLGVPNYLQN